MIPYALLGSLFITTFSSCAQPKNGIKKINAFYAVRIPGNIPADEKGNEYANVIDTIHTIYIELSGKNIEWKQAWTENKVYTVTAALISKTPLEIGLNKLTLQNIILVPSKGNSLWQLVLVPGKQTRSAPQKIKPGEILLEGIRGRTIIYQKIDSQTILQLPPSV
jgi:hypothetical protein